MNELTKEDIVKAADRCTDHSDCENCPLGPLRIDDCVELFARYIKENEPAPAGTDTSSTHEKYLHLDDSTYKQICQVFERVMLRGLGRIKIDLQA